MTESELYSILAADAGITFITTRVYNGDLPEGTTYPAVNFEFVGDEAITNFAGDTGHRFARYEISAWSKDYTEARALSLAIQNALIGYNRETTDPAHEEEIGLYRFISEYRFFS